MTMSFLLIAGREAAEEPLTMQMKLSFGTRGNFDMVHGTTFRSVLGLVAFGQGVPKPAYLRRYHV
jgi:hypothetical protein